MHNTRSKRFLQRSATLMFAVVCAAQIMNGRSNLYYIVSKRYTESVPCNCSNRLTKHIKQDFPLPRETEEDVVIFVLSRRGAADVRNTIRSSWAKGQDNVWYFVIAQACLIPPKYRGLDEGGNSACQVASKPLDESYSPQTLNHIAASVKEDESLITEQRQFQDLLLMDAVDIYRSLPKKLKYAYTFAEQHLFEAKWVVKVDDDFYVRVHDFVSYLQNNFNASKPKVVSGNIARFNAATGGKWKEVPQFPTGQQYPPFPLGSFGHAVSRPVVEFIAKHQLALFDYQGEDTSIGIWLDHPMAPKVRFEQTKVMKNNGNCLQWQVFVVGHNVNPAKMKDCAKKQTTLAGTTAILHKNHSRNFK